MKLKPGNFCPLIKDECVGLKCSWFTQVRGMNPNTGEDVDEWACAIAWIPMMQIETSQQARQAGAAVESFRNEMVKANQQNQQLTAECVNKLVDSMESTTDKLIQSVENTKATNILQAVVSDITNKNILGGEEQ
jgi:hypothetical protein